MGVAMDHRGGQGAMGLSLVQCPVQLHVSCPLPLSLSVRQFQTHKIYLYTILLCIWTAMTCCVQLKSARPRDFTCYRSMQCDFDLGFHRKVNVTIRKCTTDLLCKCSL